MGVGASLYMYDVVVKSSLRYLISWWVLVYTVQLSVKLLIEWETLTRLDRYVCELLTSDMVCWTTAQQ